MSAYADPFSAHREADARCALAVCQPRARARRPPLRDAPALAAGISRRQKKGQTAQPPRNSQLARGSPRRSAGATAARPATAPRAPSPLRNGPPAPRRQRAPQRRRAAQDQERPAARWPAFVAPQGRVVRPVPHEARRRRRRIPSQPPVNHLSRGSLTRASGTAAASGARTLTVLSRTVVDTHTDQDFSPYEHDVGPHLAQDTGQYLAPQIWSIH